MLKNKISIAVFLNETIVPVWIHHAISQIQKSDYAEIKCFIIEQSFYAKSNRKNNNRRTTLLDFYKRFDSKLFKIKNNPLLKKNLTFFNIPIFSGNSLNGLSNNEINDKIKSNNIDVIVKFSNYNLGESNFSLPKYGVWYFDFTEATGFWEVMFNKPETECLLKIQTQDNHSEQILYSSYTLTDVNSVTKNASKIYWKASLFVPRKLKELFLFGEESFFTSLREFNQPQAFLNHQNPHKYSNTYLFFLLLKHIIYYAKERVDQLFYKNQWQLQFLIHEKDMLQTDIKKFKRIIPPKDRFWADPDFIKINGKYYIFFEEYLYSEKKARISYFTLNENGDISPPKKIISNKYHMSFPFIFKFEDNVYMIPETSENRTIELYQCVTFPDKWELVKVLMNNIIALDTNLFYYKRKWWLFTNIEEVEGATKNDELFLFFADDFRTENWIPHPQNPIISDVKRARPAGNIFRIKNNIYRPSQNCSKHYGYGCNINEIVKLNEKEYSEKIIEKILPNWDRKYTGVHTFNSKEDFTIIDVSVDRRKFF